MYFIMTNRLASLSLLRKLWQRRVEMTGRNRDRFGHQYEPDGDESRIVFVGGTMGNYAHDTAPADARACKDCNHHMPTKRVAIYNIATNTLWNGMYLYLCIYKVGLLICHKLSIQQQQDGNELRVCSRSTAPHSTGWPFRLCQSTGWLQSKSSVLVWSPCTITQPLFWSQKEVWHNLNGHPVQTCI